MENTISREAAFNVVRDLLCQLEDGKEKITMPSYTLKNNNDPIGIKNVNFSLDTALNVNDHRHETFKKQRLERGFDDTELWSLDNTILRFIKPRLEAFIENSSCSYPMGVTSEEWNNTLKEMLFSIDWYLNHDMPVWEEDEYKQYKRDEQGNLIPTAESKRADKGWELFTKYFFNLWD